MPRYNVSLDLTPAEHRLVQSGEATLMGLLKDSSNKRIIKHVPASSSPNNLGKGVLIGLGVAVVIAVGTAVTLTIVKHQKNKKLAEHPEAALSAEYNKAMVNYVNHIEKGTLSLEDIKRFADVISSLQKDKEAGDISIELSPQEIETLYHLVWKFTKALWECNQLAIEKQEFEAIEAEVSDSDAQIEAIGAMLKLQQKAKKHRTAPPVVRSQSYVIVSGSQFFMGIQNATDWRLARPLWTMNVHHAMVFASLEAAERTLHSLQEFIKDVRIADRNEFH